MLTNCNDDGLARALIFQVLEQRLVQHEETALKKYADVDAKLAADPRLKALIK